LNPKEKTVVEIRGHKPPKFDPETNELINNNEISEPQDG
jgi:hypothetical protein